MLPDEKDTHKQSSTILNISWEIIYLILLVWIKSFNIYKPHILLSKRLKYNFPWTNTINLKRNDTYKAN